MNSNTNPSPEEKRYHLALALAPQIGPTLFKAILAYAGTAQTFFTSASKKLKKIPRVGKKLEFLLTHQEELLRQADTLLANQEKQGYQVLTSLDAAFPKRLLSLADGPILLFYKGTGDLAMERSVGIVGTRSATAYGKKITKEILEELYPYRPTVLSGLAFGIDAEAHRAALHLGLPTSQFLDLRSLKFILQPMRLWLLKFKRRKVDFSANMRLEPSSCRGIFPPEIESLLGFPMRSSW